MQLDAIVGTVDRGANSTAASARPRAACAARWEHIAAAMRRGEAMPPVDLVRIGEIYFVRDGHHRVSVARALGRTDIDAYVTEVIDAGRRRAGRSKLADLPLKSHERVFFERVPLPEEAARRDRADRSVGLRAPGREGRGVGIPAIQSRGEALEARRKALADLKINTRVASGAPPGLT